MRRNFTSSEHQGTFAVVTVVVVLVSGAEAGAVRHQAALPPGSSTITSQIQPDGEEVARRGNKDCSLVYVTGS